MSGISYDDALAAMTGEGSEVNTDTTEDTGAEAATEVSDNENTQADPSEELEIDDVDGLEGAPEDDGEGDEDEENEEEDEESDLPKLEPSPLWDDETKAEFEELPREAKEILLKQEAKFRSYHESKAREATEAKKEATSTTTQYATRMSEVEQSMEQAGMLFLSKWEKVDWRAVQAQDPEYAQQLHAAYSAEVKAVNALEERVKAEKQQFREQLIQEESKKLVELAKADPVTAKLIDPKTGAAQRQAVAEHLVARGLPPEVLGEISAWQMELAHDAYLYRQLLVKQREKQSAHKTAPSKTKTRPGGAPAQPSAARQVQRAKNSFDQKKDAGSALELMLAVETQLAKSKGKS